MLFSRFVPNRLRFFAAATAALIAVVAMGGSAANAATYTYATNQGAASGSWQTAGNWVGGSAPAAGSDLIFGTTSPPGARTTTNNTNNFAVNSIAFSGTTAFTLTGSSINLAGNITTANSSRNHTINLPITTTVSSTFSAGGTTGSQTLNFNNGVITNNAGLTLAGPITIGQPIAGSGTVTTLAGSSLSYTPTSFGGDLVVGGTITNGSNLAKITVAGGNMTSGSTANLLMGVGTSGGQITDPNPLGSYDQYAGTGAMAFGGTLTLDMSTMQAPGAFDPVTLESVWKLFNFATYSGNFTSVVATNSPYPSVNTTWTLGGDGNWRSADLDNGSDPAQYFAFNRLTGELVVVPEPTGFVIAGLGVAMAGWRLARQRKVKAAAARSQG